MFSDLLAYAVNGISRRMLRSALTITGIVIGIVAIVVLISLGQGISDSVNSQLESFTPSVVIVVPGKLGASGGGGPSGALPSTSGKLYLQDLQRLDRLEQINLITPAIIGRVSLSYRNESGAVSMTGIEPKNYRQSNSGIEVSQGRFLEDNDREVLVIGSKIAKGTFKHELGVGSVVDVKGEPYRIIGILEAKGDSAFDSTDNTVYVPIDNLRGLLKSSLAKDEISAIYIELKEDANPDDAEEAIKFSLRSSHKVKEEDEDFSLLTQRFIKERIGTITTALTLFLGGLASISLIVGGVTVANTMFASVLERFREIGTLKAIGASNNAIFIIFLIESIMLSLAGGITGSMLATAILIIAAFFGVPVWISWQLYAGALAFALIVGTISGFSPAKSAADLQPVDALRS